MSKFTPLFRPTATRGPTQALHDTKNGDLIFIKDALSISAWLSLGAVLQGALFLALGRITLLIPVVLLFARLTNVLLMVVGLKTNHLMATSIPGLFTAQLPNEDGSYGPIPASQKIAVLMIGTRSNHPLGFLAPGFKDIGNYMERMQKDLNDRAEEYGLLNSSKWVGAERASGNEILYAMYFRNMEGVHRFAHDPLHRETWTFWNKLAAQQDMTHMGIWHEMFEAPAGKWETIYTYSHPTLLGASKVPIKTENGTEWASMIVDASRGPLRTSKGRLQQTNGRENEKYGSPNIYPHLETIKV